ncbi:MAG: FAD-dependent oxidoreductase [Candidatus Lokiarchaeota archaeon]|nr:FAD-dependent oxidoreductase [Candidatus Lokiarchaeota archaeon]
MTEKNQKIVRSKVAIERHYLPVEIRNKNFEEVNLGYLELEEVIKECERCYQCFTERDPEIKPPPCMKYCPTHCNSREIIRNVLDGEIDEALKIIYKHYPFPRSVERVCPGYCQLHCTAGKNGDPIQIPMIKRFLVDNYGPLEDYFRCNPDIGKKIAILGSGPLGLTVAFYLRKYGINVTIFEKMDIIGGMLTTEIPEFRLPRSILNTEIENLKLCGIEIFTNKSIDKDFGINQIFESNYHAIVIGIGTQKARWLKLPGEDSRIVVQALKFLKSFNLRENIPDLDNKKVVVIGGGSTATDAARVAKRLGADVSILYRREKEHMPAGKAEIEDTENEGIHIEFLINPKEFYCLEDESQRIVCQRTKLGDIDASGRPTPILIEDIEIVVEADYIVEAIGQETDLSGFDTNKFKITKSNTFVINEKFFTSVPKVLAGGDCVLGSKSVVDAVAHGKLIADQIYEFLK